MNLVVDKQQGPYYTIASAIEAAKDNAVITIVSDIYVENLTITKPLTLKSQEQQDNVILTVQKHPNILVRVAKG